MLATTEPKRDGVTLCLLVTLACQRKPLIIGCTLDGVTLCLLVTLACHVKKKRDDATLTTSSRQIKKGNLII